MSVERKDERFLSRWSRLKTQAQGDPADAGVARGEAAAGAAPSTTCRAATDAEAPQVPPVESLDIESDYRPFFHPKIEEGVRRAALKKLFSDPHFNLMDGLDIYIDDYSKSDPLPAAMLEKLEQARKIVAWAKEDAEERARTEARVDAPPQSAALTPPPETPPEQQAQAGPAASDAVTAPRTE